MKSRTKVAIASLIASLAIIVAIMSIEPSRPVHAQSQTPPPTNDRISFGVVGITSGQTLRVNVANTIMPNDPNLPPGPTRVVIAFRGMNGQLMRNRSGEAIRRVVDLDRGDATSFDLDYDLLPPGPIRVQVRPVITVQVPPPVPDTNPTPPDGTVPSIEVINNANGRTQFVAFTSPAAIRGFNPQPDPPSPSE